MVLFSLINLFYFVTNPVKLYITIRGFPQGRQISTSKGEFESIKDEELPLYTIFIPLYKESEVLLHVLNNISKLDYPHNKLDIKIIMEEDFIVRLVPRCRDCIVSSELPQEEKREIESILSVLEGDSARHKETVENLIEKMGAEEKNGHQEDTV